jgi:hypothetical protein
MVQRYQSQGLVIPTVDSLAASITGMSLEEYKRRLEAERIAKLGPGKAKFLLENPTLPRSEAEKARQEFYAATEGPFSGFYSPESAYAAAQEVEEKATPKNRIFPTLPPGSSGGMSLTSVQPKGAPQGGPEAAAEMQPKEGETPDEYRARLEKILAAQQPSDWEKAQGYFAMAEQFLDPSKTTMQSLVGAGQAFAQSAAERDRAQREAKLALERGLLEYDMGKAQSREEAEQNASKNRVESFKYQADQALREADLYRKAADDAKSELNDYIKSLDMAPEANDPRVVELRKRIQDANGKLNEAVRRSQYYNYQYGKTFGTYGTPTFWDPANPDVLSQ